jgi:hypothetical protein
MFRWVGVVRANQIALAFVYAAGVRIVSAAAERG